MVSKKSENKKIDQIAMAENGTTRAARGAKTTWAQQLQMIIWLEVPKNFRLITGAAQKDVGKMTAGAKMKKTHAHTYVHT